MLTQFEQEVLPKFEATRKDWLSKARAVAWRLGQGGKEVTVDMVRAECPPPGNVDPRVMGAVFTRADWENCGYVKGFRRTSHARPVAMFKRKG